MRRDKWLRVRKKERENIVKMRNKGMTFDEIANELNTTRQNVIQRYYREINNEDK